MTEPVPKSRFCDFCKRPVLVPFSCSNCNGHFCTDHLVPEVHGCRTTAETARRNKNKRRVRLFAVALIFLIVGAMGYGYYQYAYAPSPYVQVPGIQICSGLTSPQRAVDDKVSASGNASGNYLEQAWLFLGSGNSTHIEYNLTAVEQEDSWGFGPGYLLNGLTENGFWYQVGVAWNWDGDKGGFEFIYQVWSEKSGLPIYPTSKYTTPVSFPGIHPNDVILLSLTITNGDVRMAAHDWRTGVELDEQYPGVPPFNYGGSLRFPTSLLIEWYHRVPYDCLGDQVVFSNKMNHQGIARMEIHEWNDTLVTFEGITSPQGSIIFNSFVDVTSYSPPSKLVNVSSGGMTIYSNSTSFVG